MILCLFIAIGFPPGRDTCTKTGNRHHKRRNNTHTHTHTQIIHKTENKNNYKNICN